MSNVSGSTFCVVHESQDHPSPAPCGARGGGRGPGRRATGAEEVGAGWLTLWLPGTILMASGVPTGLGLGDVFSECDTHRPTEDSTYIFYDPGKRSPVTFT